MNPDLQTTEHQRAGHRTLRITRIAAGATLIAASAACVRPVAQTAPAPATGQVIVDSVAARSFAGKYMRYHVLLPVHYDHTRSYPVLWLLHGYSGNDANWVDLTQLVRNAAPYPMIVVLPAVGDSWYVNAAHDTAQRAEDYMIRELPSVIEQRFAIDTTRQAIAGLSMGGYGALMLALRHPDRYTVAGGLSAAISVPATFDSVTRRVAAASLVHAFGALVTPDSAYDVFALVHADAAARSTRATPPRLSYFFVAIGENDAFPTFLPANRAFTDSLRAHRIPYEYHEVPGGHSWKLWGAELPPLLQAVWTRIGAPAR